MDAIVAIPWFPRFRRIKRFAISIYEDRKISNEEISVVISALNEEKTIGDVVQSTHKCATEVIVMDGHSTDNTREVAKEAGAEVLIDSGRGKGAAVREGLNVATRPVIVLMDADGSHDPDDIPKLTKPLLGNEADLVVGSRFAGGSDELSINLEQLVRTIGNISMNIAINKRFGVELSDTLNGFRALRKEIVPHLGLKENRHTIEQEMVICALLKRYRVINVPTHEWPRKFGRSHIRIRLEWPIFVWCVAKNLARPRDAKSPTGINT